MWWSPRLFHGGYSYPIGSCSTCLDLLRRVSLHGEGLAIEVIIEDNYRLLLPQQSLRFEWSWW